MKTRLKPSSRALFDAGRQGLAPTDDDRARVAKALGLSLGVGTGIASATAKAAIGSAAAPTALGVTSGIAVAKWVAVVALVVGVGTGGVALYEAKTARVESSSPLTVPNQSNVVAEEPPPASGALSGTVPSPLPRAEATKPADVPRARPSASPTPLAAPATPAVSRAAAAPAPAPSEASTVPTGTAKADSSPVPAPSAGAPPAPSSTRVAEEARLLRQAEAALRAGDTAGATRLLDDHASRFPDGVLAEERGLQRVLVLCAAGQTDAARSAAGAFLGTYPQSLFAERVRASCAGP